MIEELETTPSLEELARQLGMSAHHFHRVFKQITGLTPRQYAAAQREKKLRHRLGRGSTVTGAIFDAGYSSSSRFYERSNKVLGMLPSCYRAGELQDSFPRAVLNAGDSATAFQQRVWQALREIPPGQTRSYIDIARSIGAPGSARAVAGACAAQISWP